jgi:hypothetical protein
MVLAGRVEFHALVKLGKNGEGYFKRLILLHM